MMKHALARYDAYKDSGVEWIGDVPDYWRVRRVKELGNLVLGKMLDNNNGDVKLFKNYLKSKNIGWLVPDVTSVEEMYFLPYEIRLYRIKEGDLLFSEGGEVGKTSFWNNEVEECYIQNSVHKFTINRFNYSRYFLYLSYAAGHSGYYDSIVNFVSIKHLTKEKLSRVIWAVPPIHEQKIIANYLDTKTAQLGRKIDLLTQKATQYGKLKQSLINETVTRGLDKTVAMKDSGVEWIGEVPEHWEVKRIKEVFVESKAKSTTGDETLLSVSEYTGVTQKQDNIGDDEFVSRAESLVGYKICKVGDLVINIMLAWKRGLGVSSFYGIVSPSYAVYNPLKEVSSSFFHYLLRTEDAIAEFKRNSTGIIESRLRLYTDSFYALSVSIPSFEEQKAIADYLDTKTAHIDRIIETINTQVDNLKELRKTLINDVVTGKIKVA